MTLGRSSCTSCSTLQMRSMATALTRKTERNAFYFICRLGHCALDWIESVNKINWNATFSFNYAQKNNLIEDLIDCRFLFERCAQSRCSRRKKRRKKMFTFHFRWWPPSIAHNWQLICTSFASLPARTTENAINYSFILLLASIIRILLFGRRQFASSHFTHLTFPTVHASHGNASVRCQMPVN